MVNRDFAQDKELSSRAKAKSPGRKRIILVYFGCLVTLISAAIVFIGTRGIVWDGKSRLTLVALGPISLISFNPADGSVTTVPLPESLSIPVVKGYGRYRVDKLSDLDTQEKSSGYLFTKSFEQFFGIPINGTASGPQLQGNWFVGRTKLVLGLVTGKVTMSLSFWDTARFVWLVGGTRESKLKVFDLANAEFIRGVTQPDGNVLLEMDKNLWDQWVRKNLYDPLVDREAISVSVVNATPHQGLGTQVARLVENMGARVIQVRNEESLQDQCTIKSGLVLDKTKTLLKLKEVLGCSFVTAETQDERAEVVVVLGEEYWQRVGTSY